MEPHLGKPDDASDYFSTWSRPVEDVFFDALRYADDYHESSLKHFRSIRFEDLTPYKFWADYIWVTCTSGFRASVVTKLHPRLMDAYGPWDFGMTSRDFFWKRVRRILANERKFSAVLKCRELLRRLGWEAFKDEYLMSPEAMQRLPFIGPITKHHLARNLGFDYAKVDLHLVRLAEHFDFADPESMCAYLSGLSGERCGVVDFILWAYSAAFGTKELDQS